MTPERERNESINVMRGIVVGLALAGVLWFVLAVVGLAAAKWLL